MPKHVSPNVRSEPAVPAAQNSPRPPPRTPKSETAESDLFDYSSIDVSLSATLTSVSASASSSKSSVVKGGSDLPIIPSRSHVANSARSGTSTTSFRSVRSRTVSDVSMASRPESLEPESKDSLTRSTAEESEDEDTDIDSHTPCRPSALGVRNATLVSQSNKNDGDTKATLAVSAQDRTSQPVPSTRSWCCKNLCHLDPIDPVVTLCGHIFCHQYVALFRTARS